MKIKSLDLQNFRSFKSAYLNFSDHINIIIGPNNSGKSSLLLPILGLQSQLPYPTRTDIRTGQRALDIKLVVQRTNNVEVLTYDEDRNSYTLNLNQGDKKTKIQRFSDIAPEHKIIPYLAKRKTNFLSEETNLRNANNICSDFKNLTQKIDKVSSPGLSECDYFVEKCRDILGFVVSTFHSPNGKSSGYRVSYDDEINLDSMGEGVRNIVGLLVDMAYAENKVFIIEELENDLHPKALRKLLELIKESSLQRNNQFFISTHSNIIVKQLGMLDEANTFCVSNNYEDKVPTSAVRHVSNNPEERMEILLDLGYEFVDYNLHEGWIFFEEASAEVIVREFLIPWFTPKLVGKVRTFSARCLDEIRNKFDRFNELFVFIHLTEAYKNKAWVIIDSGDREKEVIDKFKGYYCKSGWKETQFLQLCEHDFETYYPEIFKVDVDEALSTKDKKTRKKAKKQLLENVKKYLSTSEDAKFQLEKSAAPVIEYLKLIESQLN